MVVSSHEARDSGGLGFRVDVAGGLVSAIRCPSERRRGQRQRQSRKPIDVARRTASRLLVVPVFR